jgi:hypothetical protein
MDREAPLHGTHFLGPDGAAEPEEAREEWEPPSLSGSYRSSGVACEEMNDANSEKSVLPKTFIRIEGRERERRAETRQLFLL